MSFIKDILISIEQATEAMIGEALPRTPSPESPTQLPEPQSKAQEEHGLSSGVMVNGVVLPVNVAQQLRELGVPLENYSPQDLHAAIQACMVDGRLVDDPNGVNFHDMLTKEASEEHADRYNEGMNYRMRSSVHSPAGGGSWAERVQHVSPSAQSFCERLLHEREMGEEHSHAHQGTAA